MKPREARRKVVLKARMRLHGTWEDACIRDISSRGLCIQSASPPPKGSYVEIYRGRHTVVARVAWTQVDRFRVYSQDRMNVDAIIGEPNVSGIDYKKAVAADPSFERRRSSRPSAGEIARRAERNRLASRTMQFATICAFGASSALLVFTAAQQAITAPLAAVSEHLQRP